MRPTLLNFRSPKERTPAPYNPVLTCDGRDLFATPRKGGSFSNERRFRDYDITAKKTGYMVGPGTYKDDERTISKKNIKGGAPYRKYHKNKPVENNAYYFIGNTVVFDPEMRPQRHNSSFGPRTVRDADLSLTSPKMSRPETANLARSRNLSYTPKQNASGALCESPKKTKTTSSRYQKYYNSPYLASLKRKDRIGPLVRRTL